MEHSSELNFQNIKSAAQRLAGNVNRTPVFISRTLNEMLGCEVLFKCENFQRTGSFKFRGAFNAISQLSDEQKKLGVITYSSGNHAQAVASVCNLLGIKAQVVMPANAPTIKKEAAENYGAEIIKYDPEQTVREDLTKKIIEENNFILIPPFDNENVVAGQATTALELFQEVGKLDSILVPCGGGGLLSGTAITAKDLYPNCKVIGVEPELADDATKSFYTKTLHTVKNPKTIADGTRTASMGKVTFPLVLKYVDEMLTVSEQNIIDAVKFLFYRMKLVVEPSGALGLAALLYKKNIHSGKVGIILSGGNIDSGMMGKILDS